MELHYILSRRWRLYRRWRDCILTGLLTFNDERINENDKRSY